MEARKVLAALLVLSLCALAQGELAAALVREIDALTCLKYAANCSSVRWQTESY